MDWRGDTNKEDLQGKETKSGITIAKLNTSLMPRCPIPLTTTAPRTNAGYYKARGDVVAGWAEYLRFIQRALNAPRGSNLHNTLGGRQIINYFPGQWEPPTLVDGYWDYGGFLTNYILNSVCQSTS